MAKTDSLIPIERIASQIYLIRGQKVMLDSDLAALYKGHHRPTQRAGEAKPPALPRGLRLPVDPGRVRRFDIADCDIKAGPWRAA